MEKNKEELPLELIMDPDPKNNNAFKYYHCFETSTFGEKKNPKSSQGKKKASWSGKKQQWKKHRKGLYYEDP